MTRTVIWTKSYLEHFIDEACLTKEEETILRTRVEGWTVTKQAMELHMSASKVNKIIARIKEKYDHIQKYDKILPPRKSSKEEEYMDTH